MRTLKFNGRPPKAFFAAVNRMFAASSQLTASAEHCFVVWTVHNDLITARSAVVGSWEEPPNTWLTVAKNAFVGWALNFRDDVIERHSDPRGAKSSEIGPKRLSWHSALCSWVYHSLRNTTASNLFLYNVPYLHPEIYLHHCCTIFYTFLLHVIHWGEL